jgi:hypothetical protein
MEKNNLEKLYAVKFCVKLVTILYHVLKYFGGINGQETVEDER